MSYQGLFVDIPCGASGYNGSTNAYRLQLGDLIEARNIRFDGDLIRKAGGIGVYDSLGATRTCYGGHSWRPSSSVQRQISVWSNGAVYKEVSNDIDSVTLDTGWTTGNGPAVFVEGGQQSVSGDRELYLFMESNAPKKLVADGGSLSAITSAAADWSGSNQPTAAVYHDARVWAFGNSNAPHNIYVSSLNDHGAFALADGGLVFDLAPGQSERMAALYSYLPTRLYAFKYPLGIWDIDTTDMTSFFVPYNLLRNDVGVAGPHCVTKVGTDVWFVSSTGRIYSLGALRPDIDLQDADISAQFNIADYIDLYCDQSKLKFARLVYDEARKELIYSFTSKDGVINDRAIIINLKYETPRISIEDRRTQTSGVYYSYFHAIWPYITSDGSRSFYSAGNTGKIYKLNQSSRAVDGSAFTAEFQTIDTDLGQSSPELAGLNKHFQFLELTISGTGSYNLSCDAYINGLIAKSINIDMGSAGSVFGSGVFGSATFGGGSTLIKRRIPLDVIGQSLSLKFYNSGLNEDFAISNIRLYYRPLGQQYEAK